MVSPPVSRKILHTYSLPSISLGVVKKVGVLKIIHERFRAKSKEGEMHVFHQTFDEAMKFNPDIKNHMSKVQDDLNPMRALELFQRISAEVT